MISPFRQTGNRHRREHRYQTDCRFSQESMVDPNLSTAFPNRSIFAEQNLQILNFSRQISINPARNKQQKAQELIKSSLKTGLGCISFKVSQEIFNSAKKIKMPISLRNSKEYLDKVFMQLEVIYPNSNFIKTGLDIASTTGYYFYDSLIISAALKAGCDTLYTENLQNGQ